ncbi:MAG TPA: Ldh family oxidoreductase [Beijerinckiaceae bacterium]|nr:Ldh family oxidoreductase [Beijerinckiaceae bacterium]
MPESRLSLEQAKAVVVRILVANRTSEANARSVARALVLAEADGLKGHGLSRVATYAEQARVGKVDGAATPVSARVAPSVLNVDAKFGFAYPALDLAVTELISLTPVQGVAAAAVQHSHHCGAMGLVVEKLAEAGLVALMFSNTPAAIAPWGGRRALFGTNPIACAFPQRGLPPVVIDLSISKVARGNILAAKQRGERIPADWAFDRVGQPTTDPDAALGGTMAPMGAAKGSALALMVETLAAGLTGSNYAFQASSFLDAEGAPPNVGQLLIAFAPECFGGQGAVDHIGVLFGAVSAEEGARLPGARRLALRARAQVEGIIVPPSMLAEVGEQ